MQKSQSNSGTSLGQMIYGRPSAASNCGSRPRMLSSASARRPTPGEKKDTAPTKTIDKRNEIGSNPSRERNEPRTQKRSEAEIEPTMQETEKINSKKSLQIVEDETQQSDLTVLSELLKPGDSAFENLVDASAQRLHNVMSSLVESREKAYLEDEGSYPPMSFEQVESVIKLSSECREYLKLKLEHAKTKAQILREIRRK